MLLVAVALLQVTQPPQGSKPATPQAKPTPAPGVDAEQTALLKVKRIYVESFGDDAISKELQAMIVSSLVATKRFKVTENRERADAILKGAALEKTSQELHAYGESTAVGGASGGGHSEVSGSVVNGNGTSDSSVNTETVSEARIAIRLVNSDGDVIWTSTQESKGAKYKGASADVADKCVKQLLRDVERLEGNGKAQAPQLPPSADSQH
jgi:curli biogenesis system outer membrane secretion channel CsgG